MRPPSEADWRVFRELRALALERFCERVLAEADAVGRLGDGSAHDRYVALYRLLERRDRELARAFDAPRRSAMLTQLAELSRLGLLNAGEIARFSADTQGWLTRSAPS